jgi:hypothetical protein
LIFLVGDLAFIPIEVLIVTIIIDQVIESREKKRHIEKLNMLIGIFFSNTGTRLLSIFSGADPGIRDVREHLIVRDSWKNSQFDEVKECLQAHLCKVSPDNVDLSDLRSFLVGHEDLLVRIIENPMIFEHESFTDLILAVNHLEEELKARDLASLPAADRQHLAGDIQRVYSLLILEWLKYMEYQKIHYPYLFSLAMRTNPFDPGASVTIR